VRRLLSLIGYDAVELAIARGEIAPDPIPGGETETAEERDEREKARRRRLAGYWLANPQAMEEARRAGPRSIHVQHRMVTVDDYARRLEEHPLVLRAHAWESWTGSWTTVRVAIIAWENRLLDAAPAYPAELWKAIAGFHKERELPIPLPEPPQPLPVPVPSIRTLLTLYVDVYRMAGQEVVLDDAAPVPITLALSVRVAEDFYQSEVRRAVKEVLGTGPLGFFRPGRLQFGEDLHASDVIEAVMALDGVENVCLNRFKRLGGEFPDQVLSGRILLEGLEVAVCDNDPANPGRGYFRLTLHGGRKG